jgi:hypothetical protein
MKTRYRDAIRRFLDMAISKLAADEFTKLSEANQRVLITADCNQQFTKC